ncbi:endonuclease/exonuclease/phosphatase family protein [Neorhizobium tomejilense]|uniref:endonuclease/exonuclease/phosphatase family protein n=1 Tax=Neorhizobium tomejilense TaxID=2093828 RepID=UPI000CFA1EAD|nr:endonuclease/exonuclease/phosphatase family protein [Neorhizobium tomejilense]
MIRLISVFLVLCSTVSGALARDLTIATWNLGWHMDIATVQVWIEECSKTYFEDPQTNRWKRSDAAGAKEAWDIDVFKIDGWDHRRLPVCNVYFAGGVVRVTETSYKKRQEQIANLIAKSVPADIIAFQEVSGEQAVKEILPSLGQDYELCGLRPPDNYKVQRLVIAWKKTVGKLVSCETEEALHLKDNPEEDQPRPGLSLAIEIDGVVFRTLTVHLKSSCVSPFESRGNLAGGGDHCPILQQQIDPLERWVERETANGAKIVLLGDFNRNFWHELRDQALVRTDGSPPSDQRPSGTLTRSILEEIVDGEPIESTLTVLNETCPINSIGRLLCTESEIRPLETAERNLLGSRDYLGCRNPVGLDHILVGPGVTSREGAFHVSLGNFGGTQGPENDGDDPKLAVSDHCPMVARIKF